MYLCTECGSTDVRWHADYCYGTHRQVSYLRYLVHRLNWRLRHTRFSA